MSPKQLTKIKRSKSRKSGDDSSAEGIWQHTAQAILTAKDGLDNLPEFLEVRSRMAFIVIRDCEQELDQLEREFDDDIPLAMTQVGERTARELIASLRFITDLERIGDLTWWVAKRHDETRIPIASNDLAELRKMILIASAMLGEVHRAFIEEDADVARAVLRRDLELDEIRHKVFSKHLKSVGSNNDRTTLEVVFMSQALERAGDHITNLGEELIHLIDGYSVRHTRRKSWSE